MSVPFRNNELFYDYSLELHSGVFSTTNTNPAFPPPPLVLPPPPFSCGNEHDSSTTAAMGGYTSSGCSSYGGSPTYNTAAAAALSPTVMMQRSISSHSLHRNLEPYSPMNSSPRSLIESSSVRKVSSTGDLQCINMGHQSQRMSSPLSNENSILESMNRTASPYSPEEKRERIERYRSKRSLRNFKKTIKYECRKTLADSRPRIRGRFARNDEIDKVPQNQWEHEGMEEDYEDDDNWIHFLDPYSANLMP